jgi:hypothetical protein
MEWILGMGFFGVLFFVILPIVLAVWAIVDLAGKPMDPVMKILWAVVIIAFPVIGSIAWLLINRQERMRV